MESEMEIDDSLYRFIIEFQSLTIQDSKTADWIDLGTQFFLKQEDVQNNNNRAEASAKSLAELNPYVSIKTLTTGIDQETDLSYLKDYQCVIVTELSLSLQIKINKFCRAQTQQIRFISADVLGLCGRVFADFGDEFEVSDVTDEELKEVFIENITKSDPGVVTCMKLHGFESGDHVSFKEINGMSCLNGKSCQINVSSPSTFEICDTSGQLYSPYEHGGIVSQLRVPKKYSFQQLEVQLVNPNLMMPDLSKFESPLNLHLGFLAMEKFKERIGHLPQIRSSEDAGKVLEYAREINQQLETKVDTVNEKLIMNMSLTCRGCFAPLCAVLGGFVAQEGLKAVSGKFSPLDQWLYLDCMEVLTEKSNNADIFCAKNDRYDALRLCIGEEKLTALTNARLFMVGCGAIGCEMLKNYALMGIGSKGNGKITITDNDLIEKSNLNRQFLFRPQHIRQPKSTTAAQSVKDINPVCPQTEDSVYHDLYNKCLTVCPQTEDSVYRDLYNHCLTVCPQTEDSVYHDLYNHCLTVCPQTEDSVYHDLHDHYLTVCPQTEDSVYHDLYDHYLTVCPQTEDSVYHYLYDHYLTVCPQTEDSVYHDLYDHYLTVCPQTEDSVYHDAFFESQDLIVNALDNVEARRYVDSRCVTNQRPLLESGTMGTKGHVQVIVPHLTESYGSQRDPVDDDVPYCTLKSFPANIEHCIQWGRDKFESSFAMKPNLFNKFWKDNGSPDSVIQWRMLYKSVRYYKTGVQDGGNVSHWLGFKFEKYFNHRAKELLHHFPLDTRTSDGSLFWQSPKRPPTPVEFDPNDHVHMLFVISTARLYADQYRVPKDVQDTSEGSMKQIIAGVKVPPYKPSNKRIVTDESEKAPDKEDATVGSGDDLVDAANRIQIVLKSSTNSQQLLSPMYEVEFEKDDDSNGHIDFITSSANLRGTMYSIPSVDRLKVKRIAGRIVPAIATTTAAVSGLVSVEILKVLERLPIEVYKNCFMNLALPVMVLSEPGPCEKTVIKEGLTVTMWDKWEVKGHKDYTLQEFLQYFKTKFGFEATMVAHGVKMVYVTFMPPHKKRLPQTMIKLLKPSDGQKYVDLVVSLQGDDEEDVEAPPVRYFFGV
ncbi:hypothetical protein FSP39_006114 [Pinctada imbricata]|uniref:Ubiquitin-activating enzyme E1 C-terminal domain-containing protein n=1 Tax=Pinctada imbricata TaxID=66713 RepID=A0AA88YD62_PINIB|nr:hypothetical protein FSP39_006114 [Pinctada imbricata]